MEVTGDQIQRQHRRSMQNIRQGKGIKLVFAFDSFKGCLTAEAVCRAVAEGAREVFPKAELVQIPLSDGGEGLVACVQRMKAAKGVTVTARGPLGEPVQASYLTDGKTAYMEMAATSGLMLVPEEKRNPLLATTYGVGEMLADALSRGCTEVVMGIGGSATCDGGRGMIECLQERHLLKPEGGLKGAHLTVACDVTNPLYGPEGAAYVYGPQKGATPQQVEALDQRLRAFARETERRGLATSQEATFPGSGAAGGLGYGLLTYLKADLQPGIDILLQITHFRERMAGADLVFTGEGKSDRQTLMGKVPIGVLRSTTLRNTAEEKKESSGIQEERPPVILISGCIEEREKLLEAGFQEVHSINEHDSRPLEVLIQPQVAAENLRKSVRDLLLFTYFCTQENP